MAEVTENKYMKHHPDMTPEQPDLLPSPDGIVWSSGVFEAISALPRLELALLISLVIWLFI